MVFQSPTQLSSRRHAQVRTNATAPPPSTTNCSPLPTLDDNVRPVFVIPPHQPIVAINQTHLVADIQANTSLPAPVLGFPGHYGRPRRPAQGHALAAGPARLLSTTLAAPMQQHHYLICLSLPFRLLGAPTRKTWAYIPLQIDSLLENRVNNFPVSPAPSSRPPPDR